MLIINDIIFLVYYYNNFITKTASEFQNYLKKKISFSIFYSKYLTQIRTK